MFKGNSNDFKLFRMADSIECNSTETSNLNNQQFRLHKINEIKVYFNAEIK